MDDLAQGKIEDPAGDDNGPIDYRPIAPPARDLDLWRYYRPRNSEVVAREESPIRRNQQGYRILDEWGWNAPVHQSAGGSPDGSGPINHPIVPHTQASAGRRPHNQQGYRILEVRDWEALPLLPVVGSPDGAWLAPNTQARVQPPVQWIAPVARQLHREFEMNDELDCSRPLWRRCVMFGVAAFLTKVDQMRVGKLNEIQTAVGSELGDVPSTRPNG